jgi:hypothetical protein
MKATETKHSVRFSQSDFVLFQREVERCLKRLGMAEWHVETRFAPLGAKMYGNCAWNWEDKTACITLNSSAQEGHAQPNPRRTARHEVLELLTGRFFNFGKYGMSDHIIEGERHGMIRRLEKIL